MKINALISILADVNAFVLRKGCYQAGGRDIWVKESFVEYPKGTN